MKKAVNVTTAIALALAASVTYNIVQHQRAKGIRPESPNQEDTQSQTDDAARTAGASITATKPAQTGSASASQQNSAISFRTSSYDKYNDELDIWFSANLQSPIPKDAVVFSPALDHYSIYTYGSRMTVKGGFKSGVDYHIRVKKGLTDISGKIKLENDAVFDVTIPELTEKFSFLTNGSVFPINAKSVEFPYSARNLKDFRVKLYKAFENNLSFASGNDSVYSMDLIGEKKVTLSDPRNETVNHMLDISDLSPEESSDGGRNHRFAPGQYVLEIEYDRKSSWSDYTYQETERRRFMLTDFAMVAASVADSEGGMAVFVRGITDGKPVADAEIELMTDKNQLIMKGKTDSTGKANFRFSSGWLTSEKSGELYAATIRKNGQFAWFPLDLNIVPGDRTANKAFVFTERGIVRPGESFLAAAFVRQKQDAAQKPGVMLPPGKNGVPLTISVISPDGRQIFSEKVTADDAGFVSRTIPVPDTAVSGTYTVRVGADAAPNRSWGETYIRVGAYVPDRIRAKLEHVALPGGSSGNAALNEPLQAILSADYYFGTPVLSAAGSIYFSCSPDGIRPAHWKDWTVGDHVSFNFNSFNGSANIENGKAVFQLPSFGSRGNSFDPICVMLQASVQEPGGRAVSGSDSFTLYPTDWFIGLKQNEDAGNQCVLDVALLTPQKGKAAELNEGRDIKFKVYLRDWDYVLVQEGDGYRRRWKETVREIQGAERTCTVPQDADLTSYRTKVAFDLSSGCYDIVAEYGDGIRTKINVWHSAGESGRRTGDPSELVFRTDAQKYVPGQTAKLTFTSPADGEAFVAMGGTSLDTTEAIPVKAGENTVEAKIPAGCLNGQYHVKMFVVGRSDGEYIRATGDASLELDHSAAHKLNVGIKLPDSVQPRTQTDVTISLATQAGKPADGQVCLFAVDEGVLALTGFGTPDIYRYFLQADDSFITMSETYSRFFPNLKILSDGTIGGGDDAGSARAASLVKMKEAVRLVVPAVRIPESGSATVKVDIPDHTGALRFMAVASSPDAVGSGEREVIVRTPVGLTVSAPRVLTPGDEAVISVRAFNHEAKDGAAGLKLDLPETLQLVGNAPSVDALKVGETKDVSFRVKALDKSGEGKLSVTLSVGSESRTEWVYLTVRPANPPQTVTGFATVEPGKDLKVDLSAEFTSVNSAVLSVSSSPAIGVKGALGWLNEYPYGCLEQTVSGAFPFVATQALVKSGLLDAEVAKTMQPKVPAAYARILSLLAGDGAFSMWPDVRKEWPEGTVYAAHFLFDAKAAKLITVDAAVQRDVTAYLLRLANTAGKYKPELRAYAAYVLASAGNREFAVPARNILAGSKPGFAQFLAAAALVRGGYAGEGAAPLRDALADSSWLYGDTSLVGITDTTARAGMVLNILMKCDPNGSKDTAAKLAAFLAGRIRKDDNCWGTTQSNAWASMGLAAFAEHYPPADLSGSVSASGKEKQALSGKTFDLAGLSGANVVSNTGSSPIFVQTVVKGVPKNARTAGGPITLKREFFDEKGNPVTSLRHGELAFVRITADAPETVENLVISDILPAGLEIEDEELATRVNYSGRVPKKIVPDGHHLFARSEKRDDRFLVFGSLYGSGYAIYTVRAVTPGKFAVPALHAEAMYDPDMNGTFVPPAGQDVFEVK